ncbi:MAG: outer membrane lipoprotein-sorting protein [Acidobacteria bacterium]|nr:outer membrane lipoprotein-sorting protein [Acidobacteriota bacterium]
MLEVKPEKGILLFSLLAVVLTVSPAPAQSVSAEEAVAKAQQAQFYAGNDMKAKVRMRLLSKEGQQRIRELVMLRKNLPQAGEQRFFIYFSNPADVRDMTFMVWKHPQRDDERWLFLPALHMVRRIAADDKRSSFVGSDFSYEDVSGREVEEDTHTLVREDTLSGRPVWVIRSAPKDERSVDFSYKLAWIDKENFVLRREEFYDKRNELFKVFTADEVKQVQALWTAVRRTMENVQNGHRTEVVFLEIQYNLGLEDSLFSERSLSNLPARWIR